LIVAHTNLLLGLPAHGRFIAILYRYHRAGPTMTTMKTIPIMREVQSRSVWVDDTDQDDANPRQCTDRMCCLIFIALVAAMTHMYTFALKNGDISKLTHGIDWMGSICGVSSNVTDKKYLYWCPNQLGTALGNDGICVSECPSSKTTKHQCPGTPRSKTVEHVGKDGVTTVTMTVQRDIVWASDVPTSNILDMYCLPTQDQNLMKSISGISALSGTSSQVMIALKGMYDSWGFLLGVAIFAIIAGFTFLYVLTFFVEIVIFAILIFVFVLLLGGGGFLTATAFTPQYNVFSTFFAADVAQRTSLILGIIVLVLWVVYCILLCCSRTAIKVTVAAIQKACEAIRDLPTLALAPVIQLVVQGVVIAIFLHGLGWVVSMGDIVSSATPINALSGVSVSGVGRSLKLQDWQWAYLFAWVFGGVWIIETFVALGQYAISYAVVIYTLNKDELENPMKRWCILCSGYSNGLIYHMGTMAFGGFIIGVLKIFTAFLSWLAKQANDGGKKTVYNRVVSGIFCCCSCCCSFLTEVMEKINEMVYVDCAIQSSNYIGAATNVADMIKKYPASLSMGRGIVGAIRMLGTLALGAGGTLLAYWILTSAVVSKSLDSMSTGASSSLYTSSITGTTVASAMICFVFSGTFMTAFDQVSNAMIYTMLYRKVHFGIDFGDFFGDDYQEMGDTEEGGDQ